MHRHLEMELWREYICRAMLLCSLGFYACSLFLPAFLFQHHEPVIGAYVLAWGWIGALFLEPGWFANAAYLLAVGAFTNNKAHHAMAASVIALLLGLSSFHAEEWWFNEGSGTKITGLGTGFYLWLFSFSVLFAGCCWLPKPNKPLNPDVGDDAPRST